MILRPTRFRVRHDPAGKATREHRLDFRLDSGCVVVEIDTELYFAVSPEFGRKIIPPIAEAASHGIGSVEVFVNGQATLCMTPQAARIFCEQLRGWCEVAGRCLSEGEA